MSPVMAKPRNKQIIRNFFIIPPEKKICRDAIVSGLYVVELRSTRENRLLS